MSKYLMRASMDPAKSVSIAQVVTTNAVNGNAGNMVFAHGVARSLYCEDTQIDITSTRRKTFSEEDVERINAEYDYFVIPLANAFRSTFCDELDIITGLIKRLKIPCIVIGVGVQAKVGETMDQPFVFDDSSKKFVKAVLEKSAMIGVRGEITAEYLKKLGFQEERDFTVIGCPSMYMHGDTVPMKEPIDLTPQAKVSVNRKINIPAKYHEFIYHSSMLFEDAMFIPQGIDDLLLLYAGKSIDRKKFPSIHETYPWRMNNPICSDGKEIGFANVPSWLDFLSTRDFSFGTRIHGNITAVMAGTPAYIFAPDSRILELARYHNIQHMLAKDITENTNIFDIYEKADFYSVQRGHKERFNHYLDFLEANGLKHAFGEERKDRYTKFDEIIDSQEFPGGITALNLQSLDEQADRLHAYYHYVAKKSKNANDYERYEKMEMKFHKLLDKTPKGMRKYIKNGIKRIID